MGRIRVLEVLASASVGGGATHLRTLAMGLDPGIFEVHVACAGDGPLVQELADAGIPVHCLPMRQRLNLQAIAPLVALAMQLDADLVHYHGTRAGLPGSLAARAIGKPSVYTVHGWSFHPRGSRLMEAAARQIERIICHLTDRVICVAESDRRTGLACGVLDEARSLVIPNGVDPEAFRIAPSVRQQTRRALGVPSDAFLVALFGRLTYQKGQRDFLLAAEQAVGDIPQARFMLVGDGEDRPALEALCHARGLDGRVLFTGARHDIPELLSACDLVVLPSYWEGLPICLLEAMAAGKPVIATKVDGSPEVVLHGKTGILVPPGKPTALARAMGFMAHHPGLAARYGELGQARVIERFLVKQGIDRLAALYGALAAPRTLPAVLRGGLR